MITRVHDLSNTRPYVQHVIYYSNTRTTTRGNNNIFSAGKQLDRVIKNILIRIVIRTVFFLYTRR